MDLKNLIFPENYDSSRGGVVEMKKLRSALGHLVYKSGRIGRLIVDVVGDEVCWAMLNSADGDGESGALVKFVSDVPEEPLLQIEQIVDDGLKNGGEAIKSEEPLPAEPNDGTADGVPADASLPVSTSTTTSTPADAALHAAETATTPATDHHLNSQLQSLEHYIANLHRTELTLRKSLMKAIDKGHGKAGSGINSMLQLSTLAIATSADEVEGMAEAEDWRYFLPKKASTDVNDSDNESSGSTGKGDAKEVKWRNSSASHALIGQIMYRPQFSPLRPDNNNLNDADDYKNQKCHWYRIVSYTPSEADVEVVGSDNPTSDTTVANKEARPNTIVQRRMRFRAVPVAESDIDLPYSEEGTNDDGMDIDDEDVEYMVLTEGQARAGVEAALLHCMIENKHRKLANVKAESAAAASFSSAAQLLSTQSGPHPFKNKHGSRIMLTPKPVKPEDGTSQFEILYGVIAGYDIQADEKGVKNRLLVLLENDDSDVKNNDGEEEMDADEKKLLDKKPCAFWSTVVDDDSHGALLTDIVSSSNEENDVTQQQQQQLFSQLCPTYEIQTHEYHANSEAYATCHTILTYLKSHSKISPFLEPVDPIALGIPDYLQVIKEPMDVGTLERELVGGIYSRIPPKQSTNDIDEEYEEEGADSPIYQMAYGPFYSAIMRIFDNCIQYNGKESWIGNEALLVKKAVEKKVQTVVSKAVWAGQGPKKTEKSFGGGRSSRGGKKSYTEDDSDANMYEYESDYEDDHAPGKRRSGKSKGGNSKARGSTKKKGKEDMASQAIEQPFVVPENAHEFGPTGGGAFPHLKIMTNVNKFSLSNDWSCRYVTEEKGDGGAGDREDGGEDASKKKEEDTAEEDEMLMLLQLQQQEEDLSGNGGTVRRSTRSRHAPQNYADEELDVSATAAALSSSSSINQTAVTLPGVEYYLMNDECFMQPDKKVDDKEGEEGTNSNLNAESSSPIITTVCTSRLGAEGVQETIHELFYAKLYHDHSPNALILESGFGKYADGSFPPYLGHIVPTPPASSNNSEQGHNESITWEVREQYLIPALRWILRGLVRSGHLAEVDGSLSDGILDDAPARSSSFSAGVVVPSHEYYCNESAPYDVLDEKEILRKRRTAANNAESDGSSEEEVELSAYEQMRAERVKRNAERLKALGLA